MPEHGLQDIGGSLSASEILDALVDDSTKIDGSHVNNIPDKEYLNRTLDGTTGSHYDTTYSVSGSGYFICGNVYDGNSGNPWTIQIDSGNIYKTRGKFYGGFPIRFESEVKTSRGGGYYILD